MLANPASAHTVRWANSLSEKGIEVFLFGLNKYDETLYHNNVKIETLVFPNVFQNNHDGSPFKIIYITALKRLKQLIKKTRPDILHAHYASSYGVLGALTGFHPYIISVWGSDIFIVPEKNIINAKMIKFCIGKADKICSTSKVMAEKTKKYTAKEIEVIPFGIDTSEFKPVALTPFRREEAIVIGTVKSLEKKYNVENLIKAFKIVREEMPDKHLELVITGGGSQLHYLRMLAKKLGIEKHVRFNGFVKHDEVWKFHNMLHIFVALSDYESFGVSALEASACGKPVVVSDADGFKEVVNDNETGFIVPRGNIRKAADAILALAADEVLRKKIGDAGRSHVLKNYDWTASVAGMINVYELLTMNRC